MTESVNPNWIVCGLIRIGLLIVNYRLQLVVTVGDGILKHDQLRGGQVESDLHGVRLNCVQSNRAHPLDLYRLIPFPGFIRYKKRGQIAPAKCILLVTILWVLLTNSSVSLVNLLRTILQTFSEDRHPH